MTPSTMAPNKPAPLLEEPVRQPLREPRWPVVLAILTVVLLLELVPGRITLFPAWIPWILGGAVLVPIVLVALAPDPARWLRLERAVTCAFCVLAMAGTIANLANLVNAMMI